MPYQDESHHIDSNALQKTAFRQSPDPQTALLSRILSYNMPPAFRQSWIFQISAVCCCRYGTAPYPLLHLYTLSVRFYLHKFLIFLLLQNYRSHDSHIFPFLLPLPFLQLLIRLSDLHPFPTKSKSILPYTLPGDSFCCQSCLIILPVDLP